MDHAQATRTLAIERYLLEEMPDDERDAFEEHFFSCVACAEDARTAMHMRDGVAGGLAQPGVASRAGTDRGAVLPFPAQPARWRTSVGLPWAAAALLAIGLGYQTMEGPLMSRHGADSVALTPSTLRPASRGQEAVVSPGPGGIVTLAVDLGGVQVENGVSYELVRADGTAIAAGKAPAPVAGAPLLLMLPGLGEKGEERFTLTLHDPRDRGLTLATYRFRVKTS
jgi:hypothetical protein